MLIKYTTLHPPYPTNSMSPPNPPSIPCYQAWCCSSGSRQTICELLHRSRCDVRAQTIHSRSPHTSHGWMGTTRRGRRGGDCVGGTTRCQGTITTITTQYNTLWCICHDLSISLRLHHNTTQHTVGHTSHLFSLHSFTDYTAYYITYANILTPFFPPRYHLIHLSMYLLWQVDPTPPIPEGQEAAEEE